MLFMCQCCAHLCVGLRSADGSESNKSVFNGLLALARISCVILRDFLSLSEFYFLICRMRVVSRSTSRHAQGRAKYDRVCRGLSLGSHNKHKHNLKAQIGIRWVKSCRAKAKTYGLTWPLP